MTLKNVPFELAVRSRGSGAKGLPQSEWISDGTYPVIGQGSDFIEGWTNREDLLISPSPSLVLYGGHTRRAKYVDFPFVLGPNVKVLEAKDKSTLDHRYLFYYLSGLQIKSRGYADHFPEVKRASIPLQPLNDQIRIAYLLGKVEWLIAQRKQHLQQLDDLLKSVFLDLFGDPVRNDRGWETKPLDNLGSLNRGISKHRPRNAPELLGGKYPLIQTGEVSNSGTYITCHSQTYSDFGFAQSKLWPSGTLCITIAANIARTGILTFDACFPDSVVGFIAHEDESHELYVHGLFWFFQAILEKNAPAAAQKNINLEILRGLHVPKPPIELQNHFAAIVERVESLRSRYQHGLNDLEALYGSLSQQAFKGNLDLSRVPLPEAATLEPQPAMPIDSTPPIATAQAINLPDSELLQAALDDRERTKDLLQFWLEAYRAQLGGAPFSAQGFVEAAQMRIADLHPDTDFELSANDYDQIKAWVFAGLADGKLTQYYADADNRVVLTNAPLSS